MRNFTIAALAVLGLVCAQASAGTSTWSGATTSDLWSTTGNWDAAPAAGDDVIFGTASLTTSARLDATATVGTVYFNNVGAGFLLDTYTTSPKTLTINSGVTVQSADTYTILTGYAKGTSPSLSFSVVGSGTLNLLKEAGFSFTKTGAGTLVFVGSNNGRADTLAVFTISEGTLTHLQAYGPNIGHFTLADGATINGTKGFSGMNDISDNVIEGTFAGSGGLFKYNAGSIIIRGNGRYTSNGAISLSPGASPVGTYITLVPNSLVLDNRTVNLADRIANNVDLPLPGNFTYYGMDNAVSTESLCTTGGYYKPSTALYPIVHSVWHGVNGTAAVTTTSAIWYIWSDALGSMMKFDGNDLGGTGTYYSRFFTGTPGGRTNNIMPYATVGQEFATYSSTRGVYAYSLASRGTQIQGAAATANVLANVDQNTITSTGTVNSLKVDGAHAIDLQGQQLTINTGGLIQTGADNTISNGTLVAGANATGATNRWFYISSDVNLTLSATLVSYGLTREGTGKVTIRGDAWGATPFVLSPLEGTIEINMAADGPLYGLRGAGVLRKIGAGALSLTNSTRGANFIGAVDDAEGVIRTGTCLPQYTSGLNTGATGKIWIENAQTLTNATVTGVGTMMMNAALDGSGTIMKLTAQGGVWSPGNNGAGQLTVNGALTFNAYGVVSGNPTANPRFSVDALRGTGTTLPQQAGVYFDQLVVTGTVTNISNVDLSVAIATKQNFLGNVLTVLTSGNVLSGNLHSISFNGTGFADVAVGGTINGGTRGWITLSNITYAGDANRDGKVDMTDYQVWFADFGMTFAPGLNNANWQLADFTGDGQVDMADYQLWFANFGDDQGTNPVPEPATLALLALGLPLLRRRRSRA